MKEKITKIEEVFNLNEDGGTTDDSYYGFDGFRVSTDKQDITVLISNGQSCCENWGYLVSEDDTEKFVGATLKDVTITDTALITHDDLKYLDEGEAMFVNFETSKGTFQIAVYNGHNGYYGHSVKVNSTQVTREDVL